MKGIVNNALIQVVDLAGNTLTLVMDVKAEGNELQAVIVSLQYNSGPIVSVFGNELNYQWSTDQNGALKKLNQDLKLDSGNPGQEIRADFKAEQNQTSIKVKHPDSTTTQTGLVLLRFRSANGQLMIQY